MKKVIFKAIAVCAVSLGLVLPASAGKIVWDFSLASTDDGAVPIRPVDFSLAGTEADWTLDGNPDNYDNSFLAADVQGGFLYFLDDASLGSNLSILTSNNSAVREDYKLSGAGDRLWVICDHQMLAYGGRADGNPGDIGRTRGQLFWMTFHTSNSTGLGLQYFAGDYNNEHFSYFTAIGNGDESQDAYYEPNRLIEDKEAPDTSRRKVTIRITENADNSTVAVDVRYGTDAYRTIDPAFAGAITSYPAGNGAGDELYLACIGNNSGSGAIEFNMYNLTITDENPDGGTEVGQWSLY